MALSAALPFHRRHHGSVAIGSFSLRRSAGRLAGEVAVGAAALAVGGFALYFLKERSQEEAEHDVLEREGRFSLRRYDRLLVAEARRYGTLADAMDEGYRALAGYIAARHDSRRKGETASKIAMTVPVLVTPGDKSGGWTVRFIMPRNWIQSSLPKPASGVTLSQLPARNVAAIRFTGRGTDHGLMVRKRDELLDWIERRGFHTQSEPEFAAYNAPIVPGRLRRNEWWVEVVRK
jgi:hypothetical protein